jgi:hypothetical protein
MRFLRCVWASILIAQIALIARPSFGQSPTPVSTPSAPAPERDTQAVATIQTSITAMGGTTAIGAIQSSTAQGTSIATPDDDSGTITFTWSLSGQDFRYENDATSGGHIFVSNSGNPCDIEGSTLVSLGPQAARANLPFHIPALALLNELNNPNYTLTYVGSATINGASAVHIQTADNSNSVGQLVTPQDWYFDTTTALPLSVQYRIPNPRDSQSWLPGSMTFASFQTVNGVLVPFQLTIQEGSTAAPTVSVTISSITFNTAIPSTQCVAPATEGGAQ